jgi:hypothetical protein
MRGFLHWICSADAVKRTLEVVDDAIRALA